MTSPSSAAKPAGPSLSREERERELPIARQLAEFFQPRDDQIGGLFGREAGGVDAQFGVFRRLVRGVEGR